MFFKIHVAQHSLLYSMASLIISILKCHIVFRIRRNLTDIKGHKLSTFSKITSSLRWFNRDTKISRVHICACKVSWVFVKCEHWVIWRLSEIKICIIHCFDFFYHTLEWDEWHMSGIRKNFLLLLIQYMLLLSDQYLLSEFLSASGVDKLKPESDGTHQTGSHTWLWIGP